MAQAMDTGVRGKKNSHARSALKARTSDVLDDFGELRKDVGRLAQAANKAARAEAKSAGHRLEMIGKDLRARVSDGAERTVETIREHPGAAIGIAAGAGLLIGVMLARR